ncbi:MAG: PDZ domain-containing protein [Ignavibacteriales bacterium]|nr:PDZ domain-containing protein [Ignavibacteriales bacterium]
MNRFITTTFISLLFICNIMSAQQMKTFSFNKDAAEFFPEIKGMAIFENGKVVLGPMPESDQREKIYQQLDLQTGDEIQFVNGNRIKTMSDFKKYFGTAEVGKEVKLGIKRNDQRFIVSFIKAKQEMGGKQVIRIGGDGTGNMKVESGKVIVGNKKLDPDSLKKAGGNVIIKSEKKK